MILFFGAAGSGKSTQAEMLAEKMNWKHVSMGELLRSIDDPKIQTALARGELVDSSLTNRLIRNLYNQTQNEKVTLIIDGYPRQAEQASWLIEEKDRYKIDVVILIDVPETEVLARLKDRARPDDTVEAIKQRIKIFREETLPVIDSLRKAGIKVVTIDGSGTIEQTHQKVMEVIKANVATR